MVEIISPKPKISIITWQKPLWISLLFFILVVAVFIFFRIYLFKIQTDIVGINDQIKAEMAKINTKEEEKISRLNDSLVAFSDIVESHSHFSQLLDLIGSLTYSKVVFTRINANKDTLTINLRGLTQNYTALAKQITAFRENENIKGVDVENMTFGTNGLSFELSIILYPKIFIKTQ